MLRFKSVKNRNIDFLKKSYFFLIIFTRTTFEQIKRLRFEDYNTKYMENTPDKKPEKGKVDRRDFIQKSLLIAGGAMGASWLLQACGKSSSSTPAPAGGSVNFTIDISTSQYQALQTNGKYLYVGSTILARDSSGNFVALYDVCTHAGCTIGFNGTNQFPCPCHGSIFDESGNVVQGPATAPVKKYTCTLSGTKLTVAG